LQQKAKVNIYFFYKNVNFPFLYFYKERDRKNGKRCQADDLVSQFQVLSYLESEQCLLAWMCKKGSVRCTLRHRFCGLRYEIKVPLSKPVTWDTDHGILVQCSIVKSGNVIWYLPLPEV